MRNKKYIFFIKISFSHFTFQLKYTDKNIQFFFYKLLPKKLNPFLHKKKLNEIKVLNEMEKSI